MKTNNHATAVTLLAALLWLCIAPAVRAQFTFTTNNGAITVTGYTGPGGVVQIPSQIGRYSVTTIGNQAFYNCSRLTSVTIPDSVTSIEGGGWVWDGWHENPIFYGAFYGCGSLTNVTLGDGVASIGSLAFARCGNLTTITIPESVTFIAGGARFDLDLRRIVYFGAFQSCTRLREVYFRGNAPAAGSDIFMGDNNCTIYYHLGTRGWDLSFSGRPTALWLPRIQTGILGASASNQFAFNISWARGWGAVIQACTNLTNPLWMGLLTNTFSSDALYFTDPQWTNCPSRFYRLNVPEYTCTNDNGTITITSYCGPGGDVTIPGTIDGLPVTAIGNDVFRSRGLLTSVTIPDSIMCIGNRAFHDCTMLTNITLGTNVTTIGDEAFYRCSALTAVTIPHSVTNIGDNAFYYCSSLTTIMVDPSNSFYSSLNGILFNKSQTLLIWCPARNGGSHIIPDSVTSIGNRAFYNCSGLTNITIGTNVTSIGDEAFYNCNRLTAAAIPDTATYIGNWAFYNCSGLANITIGTNVTTIGDGAFYDCYRLTAAAIPDTATYVGYRAFYCCSGLTNITIGTNVTTIGDEAFYNCSYLATAAILDKATYIGYRAFYNCRRLTSVTVGTNLTTIGDGAFCNCTALTTAMIPNSVTSLGFGAFYGCSALTNVAIGTNVVNIGGNTFHGCTALRAVTIPNSVTNIGAGAFAHCLSLTNLNIPDSVTRIEDGFVMTTGQSMDGAFAYCTNLASVAIGNGVVTIGDNAFEGCVSLTSVTIGTNVTDIGWQAFYRCYALTNVTIPNSVTNIGWLTFAYCTSLTSVTIGTNVTTMGLGAFEGCTNLTSVCFQGNAPRDESSVFEGAYNAIVYYLPQTTGWGPTFGGRPTAVWHLVALTNLLQVYDGSAKPVSFTTQPSGLAVNLTYNGSPHAPTNPGSYTVIGTVNDPYYQGSVTNALVITVQLGAPGLDSSGRFEFTVMTAAGQDYTIETSDDLRTWVPALAFKGGGGPVIILDPNTSTTSRRFYRLRMP